VTGEPIWPIVETPVLQSEVPGEKTWPTQPIPSKPAPYAQQGLLEADVIDYTPAIRDSALKIARRCRMGPYYIPPAHAQAASGYTCAWYAPGASGGVNIDGGAAVDVETGMMYVGSQYGLSTAQVQKDPCSEFDFSSPHDACSQGGALPPPPGYVPPAQAQGDGFSRRGNFAAINGVSILKVKELGGVTAYDMNSGDRKWWQPNGGYLAKQRIDTGLFAGVDLPLRPSGGQAQIIATKSLMIYGTGRNGRVGNNLPNANLFAVDKATGRQVGAVKIPSVTTALPMTFMHQGKQYIVFATGQGANTSLVAMALP
jgi:quinoprotein glucose dehydrogenase